MRRFSFALMLLVISQSSAQQSTETKQVSDQDLVQGVWIITGLETGGNREALGPYRGSFLFLKDKATLREPPNQAIEYAFSLDPSKTPKNIDLTITSKNKTISGIYKIADDELTLCLSMGGARPTEFATKAGNSDCERITMRRKYSDKKMSFAVDIPGKPEEKTQKIAMTKGQISCSFVVSRNDMEPLAYLVSVMPKPNERELEEAMNALKKTMLTEMAITPNPMAEAGKEFKSGSFTVREWNISADTKSPKEKGARIRIFAAGENHLVGLMVVGALDDGSRSRGNVNLDRFLSSFELLHAKP